MAYYAPKLPEPWLPGTFKNAAGQRGIIIDASDEFRVDRDSGVFHNVRFGFSSPQSDEIRKTFETLRDLIRNGPVEYDNFE